MGRRAFFTGQVVLAFFLAPAALYGAPAPVSLVYEAPVECGARTTFEASVRSHTKTVTFSEGEPPAQVRILKNGASFEGELSLTSPDGGLVTRSLSGETCATVVDGLALILAIAIDPDASISEAPPPPESSPEPSIDRSPKVPELAVGTGFGIDAITSPVLLPEFTLWFDGRLPKVSLFEPSARIGVSRSLTGESSRPGGDAHFTSTGIALDFCPFHWGTGIVTALPCARGKLNALKAEGVGVLGASETNRITFLAGALARLHVQGASPFFIEGDLGLMVNFVPDSFYFGNSAANAISTPKVGPVASVNVGFTFP